MYTFFSLVQIEGASLPQNIKMRLVPMKPKKTSTATCTKGLSYWITIPSTPPRPSEISEKTGKAILLMIQNHAESMKKILGPL